MKTHYHTTFSVSRIISLLLIFLIAASCSTDPRSEALLAFIDSYALPKNFDDPKLVLFIPAEGSCACTQRAIDFSNEHIDNHSSLYITLGPNRKVMKIKLGEAFLNKPNVLLDTKRESISQNLVSDEQYPYAYIKKGSTYEFMDLSARNDDIVLDERYDQLTDLMNTTP